MRILLLGVLAAMLAVACSSAKTTPPKSAQSYFTEGEDLFERGLYEDAIAAWEKVRESYYSPELNALAELKIAEAYFLDKHYLEAAVAYEDFLKQYPDHERIPQVLFQLGMSHYKQILAPDRDQTATRNAIVAFENFLSRFPGDDRADEARRIIRECQDRLAAHELYVGRYYLRADQPKAAIRRLEDLFARHADFSGRDQAYFYLGQSYLRAGRKQEALAAFAELQRTYPDSRFAAKAQKALDKAQ